MHNMRKKNSFLTRMIFSLAAVVALSGCAGVHGPDRYRPATPEELKQIRLEETQRNEDVQRHEQARQATMAKIDADRQQQAAAKERQRQIDEDAKKLHQAALKQEKINKKEARKRAKEEAKRARANRTWEKDLIRQIKDDGATPMMYAVDQSGKALTRDGKPLASGIMTLGGPFKMTVQEGDRTYVKKEYVLNFRPFYDLCTDDDVIANFDTPRKNPDEKRPCDFAGKGGLTLAEAMENRDKAIAAAAEKARQTQLAKAEAARRAADIEKAKAYLAEADRDAAAKDHRPSRTAKGEQPTTDVAQRSTPSVTPKTEPTQTLAAVAPKTETGKAALQARRSRAVKQYAALKKMRSKAVDPNFRTTLKNGRVVTYGEVVPFSKTLARRQAHRPLVKTAAAQTPLPSLAAR
jgi:hypothetical protein